MIIKITTFRNCSLLGTDNILGQLSVHISSPKVVHFFIYSCPMELGAVQTQYRSHIVL